MLNPFFLGINVFCSKEPIGLSNGPTTQAYLRQFELDCCLFVELLTYVYTLSKVGLTRISLLCGKDELMN